VLRKIFWPKRDEAKKGVVKITYRGALRSALIIEYYSGDQIKNDTGGACDTYRAQDRLTQVFVGVSDGYSRICNEAVWIGLLSLRIGTGGARL